jgi:uncharacterized membrane protein YeiH
MMITLLDYVGTLVFAISGTLMAAEKRFDIFGALTIGFATAIGGGTLRDMMLGVTPVMWIRSLDYFYVITIGVLITTVFKKYILKLRSTLFMFDSIGIGVFTVIGINKALLFDLTPPIAILMGMITAVAGGVIRDTLCNVVPLIFRKEIYATACILGGVIYFTLFFFDVPEIINNLVTMSSIIAIRVLAVKYGISLPKLK